MTIVRGGGRTMDESKITLGRPEPGEKSPIQENETIKPRGVINLGNKTQKQARPGHQECRTYDTCIPATGLCPLHFIVAGI